MRKDNKLIHNQIPSDVPRIWLNIKSIVSGFSGKQKILSANRRGQTLIEVLVAITVVAVIVGALVSLINASNRRATNARQATQASKLAQQGMEIVRNIRDVDQQGAVRVGTKSPFVSCHTDPYCNWSDLYTEFQSVSGDLTGLGLLRPDDLGCDIPESWCIVEAPETDILGIFDRSVEIHDAIDGTICGDFDILNPSANYDEIKQITVRVTWNSPVGQQERNAVSCLTPSFSGGSL